MSPERWNRIQDLFSTAVDMRKRDRETYLAKECDGDADLRREVDTLLECDHDSATTISLGVRNAAASLILAESLAGKRIGPYAIIKEIGQGGMGAVYLAARADDQYKKQVAIKLVKRGMDTEAVLDSFRHERQILANLDHPYIARLLDGGTTTSGVPYFVMEYVQGQPIDQFVISHNLNIEQRCELFLKVCEAVSYAHRNLVIHRDIKPTNILVTAEGTPKLLDFGIAKVLNPQSSGKTVTAAYQRMLTPDYACPEQVRGGLSTTAMDVYSLGAILYELLTGVKPHQIDSYTLEQVEIAICEVDPARPSTRANSRRLAGDLDNIVLMAMRKEPQRRYPSVDQFAEDIQRHLSGMPVLAREDTVRYRAGKFLRRHRLGAVAASLVLASLLSGIVLAAWQARKAEAERRVAVSERARAERRLGLLVQLANRSLFEVHTAIERLPGAIGARRQIIKSTLEYLNEMATDAPGDIDMLLAISGAYEKVGDLQGVPGRPNLGDEEGAWKSYQTAIELNEHALRMRPEHFDALITRIGLLQRKAMLLSARGEHEEAIRIDREGLALAESVVARYLSGKSAADQRLARIQVGIMEHALAMQLSTPDPEGAVKHVEREVEVYSALLKLNSEDVDVINSLGSACNQMGKILTSRNRLKEALAQFQKGVEMREALVAKRPDDIVIARNLTISYGYVGDTLGNPSGPNLGDRKGALEAYRKGERLMLRLITADPANLNSAADLAGVYMRIGTTLDSPAERKESLAVLRKARGLLESLTAKNPANFVHRQRLASVLFHTGERFRESGANQQALEHYGKSLSLVEGLLKATPQDAVVHRQLLFDYRAVALTYAAMGNRAAALEQVRKAQERAQSFPTLATGIPMSFAWMGAVYEKLNGSPADLTNARDAYARSLAEWRKLPADRYAGEVALVAKSLSLCEERLRAMR